MIIGIGTDLINLCRFEKLLNKFKEKAIKRLFSQREQDLCNVHPHPVFAYAKRFAAKEAFIKALPGEFLGTLKEIEILKNDHGAPFLIWPEPYFQKKGLSLSKTAIHVSLSDEPPYAIAFVVISQKTI